MYGANRKLFIITGIMNKTEKIQIILPDLKIYQQNLINDQTPFPLKTVPFSTNGLLTELPLPPKGKSGWPWTIETQPIKHPLNSIDFPKISIVTPTYNQGDFIEETIRSVLLQNYPNLEYIIFDGGSTDQTQEILEKYSPWISFCQSKNDRGQGHAINLGFSIASGNYYSWINSDDFYLPNCFEKVSNHFAKTKKDFIYGDSLILYENEKVLKYAQSFLVLERYLRFGGIIPSHAAFWSSSIHQPIWEELNCALDAELWLRLVPKHSIGHLQSPLAVARIQPEAKSFNDKYKLLWEKDYQEKIWKAYDSIPFWKFRSFEFRYVQMIYKKFLRQMSKVNIKNLLLRDDLNIV
ncbi:family 2 glycosyl transferase [Microchaete diplosiphon NIES-3275]|nr:family 2 glycosyl transferase [Microchaete diplosiphon NIES-3275]